MAVLVMEMLSSDVAFVLHTVNPLDRDEKLLSAEMAVGLGETLASGTRGSPWRFAIDKANGAHQSALLLCGNSQVCFAGAASHKKGSDILRRSKQAL